MGVGMGVEERGLFTSNNHGGHERFPEARCGILSNQCSQRHSGTLDCCRRCNGLPGRNLLQNHMFMYFGGEHFTSEVGSVSVGAPGWSDDNSFLAICKHMAFNLSFLVLTEPTYLCFMKSGSISCN